MLCQRKQNSSESSAMDHENCQSNFQFKHQKRTIFLSVQLLKNIQSEKHLYVSTLGGSKTSRVILTGSNHLTCRWWLQCQHCGKKITVPYLIFSKYMSNMNVNRIR